MRKSLLITLLILAAFAAAFLLDFRLLRGNLKAENQTATFSASLTEEQPLPMDQALDLYVIGPRRLADELAEELAGRLGATSYIGEVNRKEAPPVKTGTSLLVVEITRPGVFWTPVFGRTDMEVKISYASDGEVDWMGEEVVYFSSGNPTVRVRGEYRFRDSSFGLFSLPGYYSYLSDSIAAQLSVALKGALDRR